MRHLFGKAAGFLAATLFLFTAVPVLGHADESGVVGAACQPGQGVTVAVDFSLDGTDVDIRCAPDASGTVAEAFVAAGFDLAGATSYVTSIDGIIPSNLYGTEGYWGLYTSTASGTPAGAAATQWTFAQVGADASPVSVDQAYLFRVFDSWDCMMLDYDPTFEVEDPSLCVAKPSLPEVIAWAGDAPATPPAAITPGSADAQDAAAWIAKQLAASGDLAYDGARIDWGLTIDALFGLASAGVAGDQMAATGAKLYASGEEYIGPVNQAGAKWSAIAKLTLALQVLGLDPTTFPVGDGERNLIADLRSQLNADGSFGDPATDSAFSHALAMLALDRTTGGVPVIAVNWLLAQQCADTTNPGVGSFGWGPDCTVPDVDPTTLAVQALLAVGGTPADTAAGQGIAWLQATQDPTGGWGSWGLLNTNSTGVAAQTLGPDAGESVEAAVGFIGGHQITPALIQANPSVLTPANVGAIAFDATGFGEFTTSGITSAGLLSAMRATSQAILGLGGPQFSQLTVEGAEAGVPETWTPPVPDDPIIPDPPTGPSGTDPKTPTGGVADTSHGALALAMILLLAGGLTARAARVRS